MIIHDNRLTYGHQITPRIWQDNSGYLICYDCILARTGSYDYLESEVLENGDPNKIIKVYRTPEEVFSPEAIASFENKPFCNNHPDDDVCPQNYKDLMVGTIRNVRRGQGKLDNCLIGDIVVYDPDVIELIKSGAKRELSLGYNTDIRLNDKGQYIMTNIRGNHLALVDSGRAGCATIRDSAKSINNLGGTNLMNKITAPGKKFRYKYLDEDVFEVIDDEEPVEEEAAAEVAEEAKPHDDDSLEEIKDMLKKLCEHFGLCEEQAEPVVDEDIEEDINADELDDEEPVEEDVESSPEEEEITADDDDDVIEVEELGETEDKAMDADEVLPEMDKTLKKDGYEAFGIPGINRYAKDLERYGDEFGYDLTAIFVAIHDIMRKGVNLDNAVRQVKENMAENKKNLADAAPKARKNVTGVYAKFAGIKDSAPTSTAKDVQKSFQERYNTAAKK